MDFYKISIILFWLALFIQIIIIFYLSKFVVNFLNKFRISGGNTVEKSLKVGEKVPLFRKMDQMKREVKLDNKGIYTLLIFASKSCNDCKEIVSNLSFINSKYNLEVIVISKEPLKEYYIEEVHFIESKTLFDNYMIKSVPTIFLIDDKQHLVSILNVYHSHGLNILLSNFLRENNKNQHKIVNSL